jgi:hypothetical protein
MAADSPKTMFHFSRDELVWRRAKDWAAGGKLQPKAVGPFRVIDVSGKLGQRVTIEALPQAHHKRKRRPLRVHAAQLAPYVGDYEEPELVYDEVVEAGEGVADRPAPRRARRRK